MVRDEEVGEKDGSFGEVGEKNGGCLQPTGAALLKNREFFHL
jgi:hypothetical protein